MLTASAAELNPLVNPQTTAMPTLRGGLGGSEGGGREGGGRGEETSPAPQEGEGLGGGGRGVGGGGMLLNVEVVARGLVGNWAKNSHKFSV